MQPTRQASPARQASRSNNAGGISHGKLSLLSSLSFSEHEGLAGLSAQILSDDGHLRSETNVKLTDLVRTLWPGEPTEGHCRTLRLLSDWTKKDFLLKLNRRSILVRSDIVRALIEPTRAVLIGDDESPTFRAFRIELQDLILQRSAEERSFESSVVESIVCANVTIQIMRFQVLSPVARTTLDNIRLDASEEGVMQLYPVKAALSTFTEQMKPIVHCLNHLLHSGAEHDVALGRLRAASSTRPSRQGSFVVDVPSDALSGLSGSFQQPTALEEEHPDLEEILDNWHNTAKEVMDDATELSSNTEDAMRFLDASMSCMRNRLLKLEYMVMVPTLAMTFGNLVAGIFGMNLDADNDFWKIRNWFYYAVAFIIVSGLMIGGFLLFLVQRSRNFYSNHSERFGNNVFFRRVGDDEYILSLIGTGNEPRAISRGNSGVFDDGAIRSAVMNDLKAPALPVRKASGIGTPIRTASNNFKTAAFPGSEASPPFSPTISKSLDAVPLSQGSAAAPLLKTSSRSLGAVEQGATLPEKTHVNFGGP